MGQAPDRFILAHGDRRITVERGAPPSASRDGGGQAAGAGRWFLTIAGTALTALPAEADEQAPDLEARIHAWLDAHAELLDRDQINLGGG